MVVLDLKQTGINLRKLREDRGLTICQLSKLIGVCKAPIYRWEAGDHMPTVDHLVFLSEFYGVPIDSIVARKEV